VKSCEQNSKLLNWKWQTDGRHISETFLSRDPTVITVKSDATNVKLWRFKLADDCHLENRHRIISVKSYMILMKFLILQPTVAITKLISPNPTILKSNMADGRHVGKYTFGYNASGLSDFSEILYEDAKIRPIWRLNSNNFEFWKFKMADGFALKRYERRCYNAVGGSLSARPSGRSLVFARDPFTHSLLL